MPAVLEREVAHGLASDINTRSPAPSTFTLNLSWPCSVVLGITSFSKHTRLRDI